MLFESFSRMLSVISKWSWIVFEGDPMSSAERFSSFGGGKISILGKIINKYFLSGGPFLLFYWVCPWLSMCTDRACMLATALAAMWVSLHAHSCFLVLCKTFSKLLVAVSGESWIVLRERDEFSWVTQFIWNLAGAKNSKFWTIYNFFFLLRGILLPLCLGFVPDCHCTRWELACLQRQSQ